MHLINPQNVTFRVSTKSKREKGITIGPIDRPLLFCLTMPGCYWPRESYDLSHGGSSTWPRSWPAVFRGVSRRARRRHQRQRAVGDDQDAARQHVDRAARVVRRRVLRRTRLGDRPGLGRQRTRQLLRQPSFRLRSAAKIRDRVPADHRRRTRPRADRSLLAQDTLPRWRRRGWAGPKGVTCHWEIAASARDWHEWQCAAFQ